MSAFRGTEFWQTALWYKTTTIRHSHVMCVRVFLAQVQKLNVAGHGMLSVYSLHHVSKSLRYAPTTVANYHLFNSNDLWHGFGLLIYW